MEKKIQENKIETIEIFFLLCLDFFADVLIDLFLFAHRSFTKFLPRRTFFHLVMQEKIRLDCRYSKFTLLSNYCTIIFIHNCISKRKRNTVQQKIRVDVNTSKETEEIYTTMMRGVFLPGNSTVEFRELPIPEPGKGQILVKIKASSICGSDIR